MLATGVPDPAMLHEWLGPTPVAEFARTYLQKQPCAAAGTTGGAVALGDWAMLGRVLAAEPDVLVVARGSRLPPSVRWHRWPEGR